MLRKLLDKKLLTQQDMETALTFATIGNHLSLVKTLIYEKMDVNFQTEKEGFPLLTLAVMGNYKEIVQFLLERGAAPELRDKLGLRPLDHAERDRRLEIQRLLTNQYKKKNILPQPAGKKSHDYQTLLNRHIDRHLSRHQGAKRSHLWRNTASISKQLFSDITRTEGYKTGKDKLIIIAAQLHLTVRELKELLQAAGYVLSRLDCEDSTIIHAFASGDYAAVEPFLLEEKERRKDARS